MGGNAPTYIWRKSAGHDWLRENEPRLFEATSGGFAVIERPGRQRLLLEAPCKNGATARRLVTTFGGTRRKLPPGWFHQFLRIPAARPIRIGARLMVTDVAPSSREDFPSILIIPAGLAFGTGAHATTAMSLRLLEQVTRRFPKGWRMLDAGTGSGILALAGERFGAAEVVAIDNDPTAIATAKRNAQANGIQGVKFLVDHVTKTSGTKRDIITANLYSELLVSLLPCFHQSLAADGYLILSGVLREQERHVTRALDLNGFRIGQIRRRGKWIAFLAGPHAPARDRARNRSSPDQARLRSRAGVRMEIPS